MASFKKIFAVTVVSVALAVVPMRSQAIVPIIAGWLLEITGGSILISDLIAGQAGIISAIMWWDCNRFKLAAPCTTKTPMPAAQAPTPTITVNLQPDFKRQNPDPSKFDSPAAGKRDVTPKPKIAASGNPPPPAPAGPVGTGNYSQDPSSPETGPSADSTLKYMAQQSRAYGNVEVAGVVIVKQMFASDRAFPFVAKVVTCNYPVDGQSGQPAYDQAMKDCTAAQNASNSNLEAKYLNSSRYSYWIGLPTDQANGVIVSGKAIVFYDQASDVTVKCDAGYTISSIDASKCDLTNAAAVKKPTDTTCEILFDPATKKMLTDPANPTCDGLADTTKVSLASQDGSQAMEVSANAGNGFDINITKGDGTKTSLDTGIYDPGTGGYVIVHTTITPPPSPDNGMGCGGPGQGLCNVEFAIDSATTKAANDARAADTAGDNSLKGKMDGIDPNKFAWSFIPAIPTAACVNPKLKNPVGDGMVEMNVCGGFNAFGLFLNAVLGVLCLYGCVRQIQDAVRS